ncbi:MAG: nitroreductase family protein [Promethearchaeota archaeon]
MILQIDLEKCIKCGACVAECPTRVIEWENGGPIEKFPKICLKCGHCVAICPVNAISHVFLPVEGFESIKDLQITPKEFLNFAKTRRSVRTFQAKSISEEDLATLKESLQNIPTAKNRYNINFYVINDANQMQMISNSMEKVVRLGRFFKKGIRILLKRTDALRKSGIPYDFLLRGAPAMAVITSSKNTQLSQWDAGIAAYHLTLAATALGIGSCMVGYHTFFAKYLPRIKKLSGVPKGEKVMASVLLGYPKFKYQTTVPRKEISWNLVK